MGHMSIRVRVRVRTQVDKHNNKKGSRRNRLVAKLVSAFIICEEYGLSNTSFLLAHSDWRCGLNGGMGCGTDQ